MQRTSSPWIARSLLLTGTLMLGCADEYYSETNITTGNATEGEGDGEDGGGLDTTSDPASASDGGAAPQRDAGVGADVIDAALNPADTPAVPNPGGTPTPGVPAPGGAPTPGVPTPGGAPGAPIGDAGSVGGVGGLDAGVVGGSGGNAGQDDEDAIVTEPQIVGVALAVYVSEVDVAKLALPRAADPRVRDYAQAMIALHEAAQQRLIAVGIAPEPSPKQAALAEAATKANELLANTPDGAAFDLAYMESQVTAHGRVRTLFDGVLRPRAVTPDLKTELKRARDEAVMALVQAQTLIGGEPRIPPAGPSGTPGTGSPTPTPTPSVPTPSPTPPTPTPGVPTPTPGVPTPGVPTPGVPTPTTPGVPTPGVPTPTPGVPTPGVPTPAPGVPTPTPGDPAPGVPTPTPSVPTPTGVPPGTVTGPGGNTTGGPTGTGTPEPGTAGSGGISTGGPGLP